MLASNDQRFLESRGFAAAFLLLLTFVFTYPAVFHLSTHLLGGVHPDAWQWPWNIFNFRERILHGQDPYYTDYVFYPVGTGLLFHTYTEFNDVLGLLLHPFFNDIAITNIVSLVATFLSAFGTYLLARLLTRNAAAALFAAIAFAFCPFRTIRMMYHLNLAMTQFIPFALWAFLRMMQTLRLRDAILTGVFFALTCYCNYMYGIYLVIAMLCIFAIEMFRKGETTMQSSSEPPEGDVGPGFNRFSILKNSVVAAITALILLFPIPLHFYKEFYGRDIPALGSNFEETSARLSDYLAAAPNNPFIRDFVEETLHIPFRTGFTSGWTALLLALAGGVLAIRARQRKVIQMMIVGFIFLVLSLGPGLKLGPYTLPLPYSLLADNALLRNIRVPARFAIMVTLVTAILAAYAFAVVMKKWPGRRGSIFALTALSILMVELAAFPLPMAAFDPPKVFSSLQQAKGEVMITVPFDLSTENNARASQYLAFQIIHKKKALNGKVSRDPYPEIKYFGSIPVARSLHRFGIGVAADRFIEEDRVIAPAFRQFFDVRYLTLFPPFSTRSDILNYVREVFPDAKLLADEHETKVYELPAVSEAVLQFRQNESGILFFLLEGWEIQQIKGVYRIVCLEDQARFLLPEVERDRTLRLQIRIRSGNASEDQTAKFSVGDMILQETKIGPEFENIRMDIPESLLANAHHVLNLVLERGKAQAADAEKQPNLELGAIKVMYGKGNP